MIDGIKAYGESKQQKQLIDGKEFQFEELTIVDVVLSFQFLSDFKERAECAVLLPFTNVRGQNLPPFLNFGIIHILLLLTSGVRGL